jgi:hypothetical protein
VRALHIFSPSSLGTMNPNLTDQNDPDPMLIVEAAFFCRSSGAEHQPPVSFENKRYAGPKED